MTIITNNDDDDDDNNTNINDYSVILLKVYFLCFVATELFFPLSPFLKKKEFCKGSCDPLLNRSYWLTHVDVDELYRFFLPVRPALQCLYLAWITVYVLIFYLFDFFWTNHFLVTRLRPRCRRGRGCARLYRFMRFLLVFWELYSNTFQVCIEKHSSHLSHVDLERCISAFSVWNSKKKRKKTVKISSPPLILILFPFFFNPFFFFPSECFCAAFSPSSLVNGCSFMWDVRAGKPIECSVYIKSHSFHDYNLELFAFDCYSFHW